MAAHAAGNAASASSAAFRAASIIADPEGTSDHTPLVEVFQSRAAVAGRNEGPGMLLSWWLDGVLTPADLSLLLASVWGLAEFPEVYVPRSAWLSMFREAGFVTDTPGVEPPGSALRVYRGATWGRRRRMAWTTDIDRARRFARRISRSGSPGVLVAAIVPANGVLAVFNLRGESEIVVDPASLTSVRRLAAIPGTDGHRDAPQT